MESVLHIPIALARLSVRLRSIFHRIAHIAEARSERRLRLRESVSLGDKRLVALLECDGRCLLVGAANSSITVLADWNASPSAFAETLAHSGEMLTRSGEGE